MGKSVCVGRMMLLRRILEGMLADECYEQAKNEGCKVEVVWQDGDSCAAKSISQHHPTGNIKCVQMWRTCGESAYQ